jgi:hypothetical protein
VERSPELEAHRARYDGEVGLGEEEADLLTRDAATSELFDAALAVGAYLWCGSPETTLWQGAMALACALGRGRWLASGLGLLWGDGVAAVTVIPPLELAAHSARAHGRNRIHCFTSRSLRTSWGSKSTT